MGMDFWQVLNLHAVTIFVIIFYLIISVVTGLFINPRLERTNAFATDLSLSDNLHMLPFNAFSLSIFGALVVMLVRDIFFLETNGLAGVASWCLLAIFVFNLIVALTVLVNVVLEYNAGTHVDGVHRKVPMISFFLSIVSTTCVLLVYSVDYGVTDV